MRFFQKVIITTLLFASAQLKAFTPESGFWWNRNETGSGYAIEIQDNYLFVALYVYDQAGNPIWYTAGATLGGNYFLMVRCITPMMEHVLIVISHSPLL